LEQVGQCLLNRSIQHLKLVLNQKKIEWIKA
ncbi:MAG: hypothetical protein ACI8YP_003589, partial [Algoriphagus sp.]